MKRSNYAWIVVIVYLLLTSFTIIEMLWSAQQKVTLNTALIEELRSRKEEHIAISADNNRILRELLKIAEETK